ncbi:unnamed protein product [Protopolystoma xenopodis]|uniref:Uncharacterized protein n=1 Tax=Protopolystoma xenopodis TaxID=117903 RepID=A0A3S5AGZ0_9PLAT|nr:unnamed protein product [Protopolystoma xenopodis]
MCPSLKWSFFHATLSKTAPRIQFHQLAAELKYEIEQTLTKPGATTGGCVGASGGSFGSALPTISGQTGRPDRADPTQRYATMRSRVVDLTTDLEARLDEHITLLRRLDELHHLAIKVVPLHKVGLFNLLTFYTLIDCTICIHYK